MAFLMAPFLSACTQIGAGIMNAPTYFDNVRVNKDIAYGDDALHRLDMYVPANVNKRHDIPILVFIHGGNWQQGNKNLYRFVGSHFAKNGYMVIIPNYRKYPQVKYPDFVEDAADAVAWAYKNGEKYGGNPETLYLMGHSAGGHIAAMLSSDQHYLEDAGVPFNNIKAFAGLAGPYDFIPKEKDLKDIFGPPEKYKDMQATTFIDGSEPPMLLLHGSEDETVYFSNIEKLEAALKQKKMPVEHKVYQGVGHIKMVTAFTWLYGDAAPISQDVLAFFAKYR